MGWPRKGAGHRSRSNGGGHNQNAYSSLVLAYIYLGERAPKPHTRWNKFLGCLKIEFVALNSFKT